MHYLVGGIEPPGIVHCNAQDAGVWAVELQALVAGVALGHEWLLSRTGREDASITECTALAASLERSKGSEQGRVRKPRGRDLAGLLARLAREGMHGGRLAQRVHDHRMRIFPGQAADLGRLMADGRYVNLVDSVSRVVRRDEALKFPHFHQDVDARRVEAGLAGEAAIDVAYDFVRIAPAVRSLHDRDDEIHAVAKQAALVGRVRRVRRLPQDQGSGDE